MIRLRPYYLFSLLRQLAAGDDPIEDNSLPEITRRLVDGGFQEEIQLVGTFCDACRGCPKMVADENGCLWGEGYRCVSADTAGRLREVENQMRAILYDLNMHFGDAMPAGRLIKRAAEARPFHYFHIPEWQSAYEEGLAVFEKLTGIKIVVPQELLAKRHHYESYPE